MKLHFVLSWEHNVITPKAPCNVSKRANISVAKFMAPRSWRATQIGCPRIRIRYIRVCASHLGTSFGTATSARTPHQYWQEILSTYKFIIPLIVEYPKLGS